VRTFSQKNDGEQHLPPFPHVLKAGHVN
jgi:hypothetical protein